MPEVDHSTSSHEGSSPTRQETPEPAPGTRLQGNLGVFDLVIMVLSYAGPLVVVGLFGAFVIGYGVGAATPLAVVLVAGGLCVFTVGYVAMSQSLSQPGALYTYVTAGLGRVLGLSSAFLANLTYLMFGVTLHSGLAIVLKTFIGSLGGPEIPWQLIVIVSLAVTGVLGHFRVDVSAGIMTKLMVVQVIAVLVWNAVVLVKGGPQGTPLDSFVPANLSNGSLPIALLLLITGFVGFESTAVFRDEVRDPNRTIPRAAYISITTIAVFYVLSFWASAVAYGPDRVVNAALSDPAGFFPASVREYLGSVSADLVSVMLVMSYLCGVIAAQNILSRYLHALGADGVLKWNVGRVHPRHGSPYVANILATALLIVMFVPFVGGDPEKPYTVLAAAGVLALLLLLTLSSIAVVVYFRRDGSGSSTWKTVIAPLIAAVLMVTLTGFGLLNLDVLGATNILTAVIFGTAVLGAVVALVYRRVQPETYRRIGRSQV
ncbi:APC family permease [Streptosporangium sp. NBC_01495]|uniref:APC family permease n=1 Tax=Streptosporangium sp. NBC_01495 TaxID=2903899 RepID=UPI002E37069A|nr:APC family permease [Streptosporangium sp. NBC_01495]